MKRSERSEWVSLLKHYSIVVVLIGGGAYAMLFLCYGYNARVPTLQSAQEFASSMEEHPPVDNNNWYKPDYSTFFLKQLPSFGQRVLYTLGITKPFWSVQSFVSLLEDVTNSRKERGLQGDFVQKVIPFDQMKLVIWGNLQGAFHSFVRDLEYLQEQSVIDNSLTIIDPNYYFVFTGNAVSRSAYSLETLLLIVRLMQANLDHVIYLRGTHEDHQYWQDFDMRTALRTHLWQQAGNQIPLADTIDAFFDTLPYALFVVGEETKTSIEVLMISNEYSPPKVELAELDDFLRSENKSLITAVGKEPAKIPDSDDILIHERVHIISNHYKPNAYLTEGLRMVLPRTQSAIWTILSSPTSSYKQRFNFENDAFSILKTTGNLTEWSIALCKQNSYTLEGFDCSQEYNLVSGFPTDFPHTFTGEIVIGSSLDLSMVIQRFGEYLEEGMQARIRDENEKGGVQGQFIRLIVKDDGYHIRRARQNIEDFIREGIDIILCPLGTSTVESYLDLIKEKKVLVLFPAAGGHESSIPYLLYYRPSSFDEGKVITAYAIEELNSSKFAFFYPTDTFGMSAMEGAKESLLNAKRGEYKEFPYKRDTLSFVQQAKGLLEYDPGTVAFFSITPSAQEFVRQIGVHRLSQDRLIGLSALSPDRFRRFLSDNGLSVTITSVVPSPRVASIPLLEAYQESMQRNRVDLNTNSLEGYIAASLFIEALKRVDGKVTKDKIVAVLESIKDFDMGGLPLNFNAKTRSLSDALWVAQLPQATNQEWERVDLMN